MFDEPKAPRALTLAERLAGMGPILFNFASIKTPTITYSVDLMVKGNKSKSYFILSVL